MNNIKTLLTFNDEVISIILFNNFLDQTNILFQKSMKLTNKAISNGYIANREEVFAIIKTLINEASSFVDIKIDEVFINIDCNEIAIKRLELTEIELEDKIFDINIWKQIESSINIKQITEKYIYDVNYISWSIDGKEYFEISNNAIAGNRLVIKAIIYQINKILFQNYVHLLEKLNIKIISLLPMINTFEQLVDSSNKNHNELFIYINHDALTIVQTSGKNIERCESSKKLGLNNLFEVIANENNISLETVNKIIKTNILFNNENHLEIISDYDCNKFCLKEFDTKKIKKIIDDYIKSIANTVNQNINFLEKEKHLNITKATYIPINKITNNIINLTQIHNDSNKCFIYDEKLKAYEEFSIQENLMLDYIMENFNSNSNRKKLQTLSNKYKREINHNN